MAGGASSLIVVVMIGLLAAMAIPAFQKVRQASIEKACFNNRMMLAAGLEQHTLEHGKAPQNFSEIVGPAKYVATMPVCPGAGQYNAQKRDAEFEVSCTIHGVGRPAIPARP